MSEHTPGDHEKRYLLSFNPLRLEGQEREDICEEIMRRWDCHADMLEALRKAQAFLDVLEEEYVPKVLEGNSNDADGRLDWDVRYHVQDAIAKVKGKA